MRSAKQNSHLALLVVVAIATAFSSLTLWLLDSWMKYPFFIFEVLVICALYLIFIGYNFKFEIERFKIENLYFDLLIDAFLVVSATIILLFNLLGVQGELLQLILAFFVTSILPGYALLNIFGLNRYFSKLQSFVMSFVLSFAFTGLLTLCLLPTNENIRLYCALSVYILIGLISLLKRRRESTFSTLPSFARNFDGIVIAITVAFLAISYYFMYPGFALLPGTDASQHYAYSILLWRTPALYNGAQYLFAHLHESLFIALSNSSLVPTQLSLLSINLLLPLAFYIMAKQYLEKIDTRLPSIATIFWVLFTNGFGGFSWFYFVYLKLFSSGYTQLQLLSAVADKTYNGTIYGIFGLWYVPATISFILLMAAIFLLSKKEIPPKKFLALFFVIISALYLTHVTEAVIFVSFLAVYGFISKNEDLKIDTALKASIISFITVFIVYYVFSQFSARFTLNLGLLLPIILPVVLLLLSLVVRRFGKLWSVEVKYRLHSKSILKIVVSLLVFLYLVALLSLFSLTGSFHTWQVDTIGLVPWFMYPLMLGITGLLSVMALYYIAGNTGEYRSLKFFIIFMIFVFIVGILVSVSNLYFFNTGYWEKRFIWFIKLPLAFLAPIPLTISIVWLKKRVSMNNFFKKIVIVTLIGIVVLSGISTTFLNVEYWNIATSNPQNYPSNTELNAVTALKDILNNDPNAWLATITSASASIAAFAAPADTTGLPQLIYTASTPEMFLTQLYRHPAYSHPYIYVADRDRTFLNASGDQIITSYLALLPIAFNNSEVTIYNATKPSFPQAESENTLIVPFAPFTDQQNILASYYILSNGLYNYTVAYDIDHNALNTSTLILSYDPPENNIASNTFQDNFNQALESWSTQQGTWNVANGRLNGGETGNSAGGVLLSPVSAENFTATVTINPLNGDTTTSNYARFIYSWTNSANYRIADICLIQMGTFTFSFAISLTASKRIFRLGQD